MTSFRTSFLIECEGGKEISQTGNQKGGKTNKIHAQIWVSIKEITGFMGIRNDWIVDLCG